MYDLAVHGPNGFFRSFKGNLAGKGWIAASTEADPLGLAFVIKLSSSSLSPLHVQVENMYSKHTTEHLLFPVGIDPILVNLVPTSGWYDLVIRLAGDSSFLWRIAGHVETGRDSITDPGMGLTSG